LIGRTNPNRRRPPPPHSPITKSKRWPNGLKVFVIEDERTPTVVFRLIIKGGSIFDGEKTG
jgi:predicted Zn-dependent peptidase